MRGIVVPEPTEDFSADPVELTFDLAFVFAYSRLVGLLVADHTWAGIRDVAVLFLLLWLPWTQFTWAANAVAGNQRNVRLLFLGATVFSIPMAAAVTTAFGDGGRVFALCLGLIHLTALVTMALGIERGSAEHASVLRYLTPNVIAIVLVVVGSFLHGDVRRWLWLAGLLVVVWATVFAGEGDWIVRSGHFAERHALIFIIALGEVIVAIGVPVLGALEEGRGLPGATVLALLASGIFAAVLWWGYFDRPQRALEHHAAGLAGRSRARFVRDAYTYAHAPVVAGVILAAAGLEEITLHPLDAVPTAYRAMLAGGVALVLLGVVLAVRRAYRVVPMERLVALAVLVLLVVAGGDLHGVVLLLAVDLVLIAALVVEHVRIEVRREPASAGVR